LLSLPIGLGAQGARNFKLCGKTWYAAPTAYAQAYGMSEAASVTNVDNHHPK